MTLVNFAPRPVVRNRNTKRRSRTYSRSNPYVNILHKEDTYLIELAVPGIAKDQIILDVKDDQLHITAEQAEKGTSAQNDYLRKEYDYSSFNKVFNLTDEIDQNQIEAALNNGVLSITLHKKEEAKAIPPRKISIQ